MLPASTFQHAARNQTRDFFAMPARVTGLDEQPGKRRSHPLKLYLACVLFKPMLRTRPHSITDSSLYRLRIGRRRNKILNTNAPEATITTAGPRLTFR